MAFDAFVPLLDFGWGAEIDDTILDIRLPGVVEATHVPGTGGYSRSRAFTPNRDDLNTPVMVVSSECETLFHNMIGQPDSAFFRFWEVAGASHSPGANWRIQRAT